MFFPQKKAGLFTPPLYLGRYDNGIAAIISQFRHTVDRVHGIEVSQKLLLILSLGARHQLFRQSKSRLVEEQTRTIGRGRRGIGSISTVGRDKDRRAVDITYLTRRNR